MYYKVSDEKYEQRLVEWNEIDRLVLSYQKQFLDNATQKNKEESRESARILLEKFSPLFNKYKTLLKTGQIDWNDYEMKQFVLIFIDDIELKRALSRKKQKAFYRNEIYKKFNFIVETYGALPEDEITSDLQTLLLIIAKRYKNVGKNFCAYTYNAYRFEVARHIKKFTKNPINITYKNLQYEDCINGSEDFKLNQSYEDQYYEDNTGVPNISWIQGQNCSHIFSDLTPVDRKILIKYYLEEYKDGQIAESLGMHINTVNQKRRNAAKLVAIKLNLDLDSIKRTRKSGKKAITLC